MIKDRSQESIILNSFMHFLTRTGVTLPTGAVTWVVSLIAFDQTFMMSVIYALLSGTTAYLLTGGIMQHKFLKKHALTRKEYKFIQKQLKEANGKINRLNRTIYKIRHFSSIKQRIELMRMTKKIYRLTQQDPKRFYLGEQFYYSHLDSVVEIAEKYALLSAQPKKNRELQATLTETRNTLSQLSKTIEEDLHKIVSDDIDDLHFELDVVKHTTNKNKDKELIDESRKWK